MKQWETGRTLLEQRANQRWYKFPPGKAKRRHNLDGIILDAVVKDQLIKDKKGSPLSPDFLVKNTYTSFVPNSRSNFPNGCELVIRNLTLIENIRERG